MTNQANIMNMLQSKVADIGSFAHDNRFAVFFDNSSGAEYKGVTKMTKEKYTRADGRHRQLVLCPGAQPRFKFCATLHSHIYSYSLGGYSIRIPGRLHPVYGSNRRVQI